MRRNKRRGVGAVSRKALSAAATAAVAFYALPSLGNISIVQNSGTSWSISNGDLSVVFNPTKNNINKVQIGAPAALGPNILDPGNSQLYPEFAGTPFGAGTQTSGFDQTPNYIDFWASTASTGTAVNPLTYAFHYVMFNNDPAIHMYEVVNHSATDPATSVGQGQFLMRVDPAKFNSLYQVNTAPNNLGVTTTQLPANAAQIAELNGTNGYGASVTITNVNGTATFNPRKNLPEVLDLNGDTDLIAGLGRNFLNKYDYTSYEQFRQGQTEVGPAYTVSSTFTSHETFTGGPTKQNLQFTDNILMAEFLSSHEGLTTGVGYAYVPPQGVNSTKLFGPYIFRAVANNGETPGQLYQDAVGSVGAYPAMYDQDATLAANGYVASNARGKLLANISSTAGWSPNVNNNTIVLADDATNFQSSHQGYQYWQQVSTNGQASFDGVVPGTYRASIYQYGQWGETRINGVQVVNGKVSIPQNLQFVPENFSSNGPIWSIGTPDRSSHEFLNGHFTTGPYIGQDNRNYWGSYNYWQEEADLGNNGKVVYYATDVPGHTATNDPNKWIGNQWLQFDPALYDPVNNVNANATVKTVGLYPSLAPAYVGNPASYNGLPWEVHFATTAAQAAGDNFVILSVGLAGVEGSLTITLNGVARTYHNTNRSDPMIRSALAGYYQWAAFEWPLSALTTPGLDNLLTFGVSSNNDGIMYDALRLELSPNSANPNTTGWFDYEYINGTGNNAADAQDSKGISAINAIVPEPTPGLILLGIAAYPLLRRKQRPIEQPAT